MGHRLFRTGPDDGVGSDGGDDSAALMQPALDFMTAVQEGESRFFAMVGFIPHKPIVTDPSHTEGYSDELKILFWWLDGAGSTNGAIACAFRTFGRQ